MENNLKPRKPADIDGQALINSFRGQKDSAITNPPAVNIARLFNPDPRAQRVEIANKFDDMQIRSLLELGPVDAFKQQFLIQPDFEGDINLMSEFYVKQEMTISTLLAKLDQDPRTYVKVNGKDIHADTYGEVVLTPRDEIALLPFTQAAGRLQDEDVSLDKINIDSDKEEGLHPEMDLDMIIEDIHAKLFDPNYDQNKPKKPLDQIKYRSDLIIEAREILNSMKYKGFDILVDNKINWKVLAILQEKFNTGKEFTKLERVIVDVASFYLSGGPIDISTDLDYRRARDILDTWIDNILREYGALGALGGSGRSIFMKLVKNYLKNIFQLHPDWSLFEARLILDAKEAFETHRESDNYKVNIVKRGRNLIYAIFDAFDEKGPISTLSLEQFAADFLYGAKSEMSYYDIARALKQMAYSDRPASFEFLAELFRYFEERASGVQEEKIIKALKEYNPVFSIFLNEWYYHKDFNKLEKLNYLLKSEEIFNEYYEEMQKEYEKVKGDINAVRGMNQYCTISGAYWTAEPMISLQTKLLLDLWDGRDALTGEKLVDENGNILRYKIVDRHHYTILEIHGTTIIFIKYDCRLSALVPLSRENHGTVRTADNAQDYADDFKRVMEKLMRGEWATPDWWLEDSINGERRIKSFEENLLRLGYVKPNNLD